MKENRNTSRIRLVPIIQLIFLIVFLLSHFLVWGYYHDCWDPSFKLIPFIGLDSEAGWISIILLNIFFILNILFFFEIGRKKYSKVDVAVNTISIIICPVLLIILTAGVFSFWEDWMYQVKLSFGFYLWLFSAIINIGALFIIKKILSEIVRD